MKHLSIHLLIAFVFCLLLPGIRCRKKWNKFVPSCFRFDKNGLEWRETTLHFRWLSVVLPHSKIGLLDIVPAVW
jgi:hypothetical protein